MLLRKFNRAFFYFELKTGTLLLLSVLLILSSMTAFLSIHYFNKWGQASLQEIMKELIDSPFIHFNDLPFWSYLILVFGIMPSAVALFGALTRNSSFVMFYVIMNLAAIVSWIITIVVILLLLAFGQLSSKKFLEVKDSSFSVYSYSVETAIWKYIVILTCLACSSVVNWYFTSIVYSFHQWMEYGNSRNAGTRSQSAVYSLSRY